MDKKIKAFIDLTRINRPAGIMLLALPCWFGVFLAAKNTVYFAPDFTWGDLFRILFLFSLGAVLMRSAGCVINDIFDRKFDAQVARTKMRPLPSGRLSVLEAVVLLMVLLFLSLLILLQFNFYAIVAGLGALGLVVCYPLMKRITFYPQIFLGLTFNYGILMADLAINQAVTKSSLALFAACIIWTLIYDSIYAFQDIEDDLLVGVKSSAIKFAKNPKIIFTFLTAAMFVLIGFVGFLQDFYLWFYLLLAVAFFYEIYLVIACDYSDPRYCLKVFKANVWVGILILAAIILG